MLQCTNNAETKLVVAPSMQSPATAQHVSTVAIIVSLWALFWLFGCLVVCWFGLLMLPTQTVGDLLYK